MGSRLNPYISFDGNAREAMEFYRDVRPLLVRSCVPCHTQNDPTPPGNLVLDDTTEYGGGLPGDYLRLAEDTDAEAAIA